MDYFKSDLAVKTEQFIYSGELNILFWQLAKKLHPDTNKEDPDAEKKFQEVSKAYEVISVHFYLSSFCSEYNSSFLNLYDLDLRF